MSKTDESDLKLMEKAVKNYIKKYHPELKDSTFSSEDVKAAEQNYHRLREKYLSRPKVEEALKNDAYGPNRTDAAAILIESELSKRKMDKEAGTKCKYCGSTDIVPISYGLLRSDVRGDKDKFIKAVKELEEKQNVKYGGDIKGKSTMYCKSCKKSW